MPSHSGVKLALFLQFHTGGDVSLEANAARIRFAYRNFYPQSFVFERVLACDGGTVGSHAVEAVQTIPARREGRYREDLLPGSVPVQRGEDGAAITADIKFTQPPALDHIADTLSVTFPALSKHRCVCCLRSFPS